MGFLNLLLVGGLAAISAPIIIHLIHPRPNQAYLVSQDQHLLPILYIYQFQDRMRIHHCHHKDDDLQVTRYDQGNASSLGCCGFYQNRILELWQCDKWEEDELVHRHQHLAVQLTRADLKWKNRGF